MKAAIDAHAIVRVAVIILLFLSCYGSSAHAFEARRSKWGNFTTARSMIDSLEDPKRIKSKQRDRVLELLGVKPGDVVADVGCGTGSFTFLLADRVGKDGTVYATDILDDMLTYVGNKMKKDNINNILPVKSSHSDPHLPNACCDKILLFNTYRYIGNKVAFFGRLHESLKHNGSMTIISPYRRNSNKGLTDTQLEDKVIHDMSKIGFKFKLKYKIFADRYFLVFTK